jgi:hypothetical protein
LLAAVLELTDDYRVLFEFSHLPFFPEYTDHGPVHVERVLNGMVRLATAEAFDILTPRDAAVLVLAAVFHDSALHLTERGFLSLMESDQMIPRAGLLGDRPWRKLWHDYMAEAVRWDVRRRRGILGDERPVRPVPDDPQEFTGRDRLLIGEFLRRHHARLAHEIALLGFPGVGGRIVPRAPAFQALADVAGIVARSHGMDLRDTFAYLTAIGGHVRTRGDVHTVYLMALLRIADYLEIEAARAPALVTRIRHLHSPLSTAEWNAHHAIDYIDDQLDDREAMYVRTSPEDVRTFIKIRDLLRAIQRELDQTWAVLGEVYGRVLPNLGLTLRRVVSNLDDESAFAATVEYLPREVYFRSAGADLLKLLIEPLYGNVPEIGVRELIQNSVDAVRALERYRQIVGDPPAARDGEPDVVVEVKLNREGERWLVIRDRGIGMNADVIENYFLTAGANYRASDAWRRMNLDEAGRSEVYHTGRFGVGLLAAFMLGREVEVSTRYVEDETGLSFAATIAADSLDIRKTSRDVGTTICIRLHNAPQLVSRIEQLGDWYCLAEPRVERRSHVGALLPQRHVVPSPEEHTHRDWRRTFHPDYAAIDWTYDSSRPEYTPWRSGSSTHSSAPALTCNGFRVVDTLAQEWDAELLDLPLAVPRVSYWDPDANLPLTVRRDALQVEALPGKAEIQRSIARDYLAHALVSAPTVSAVNPETRRWFVDSSYWGWKSTERPMSLWISTPQGIAPMHPWHLRQLRITELLVLPYFADVAASPILELEDAPATWILPLGEQKSWMGRSALSHGSEPLYVRNTFGGIFADPLNPMLLRAKRPSSNIPLWADYQIVGGEFAVTRHTALESRQYNYLRTHYGSALTQDYFVGRFGTVPTGARPILESLGEQLAAKKNAGWQGYLVRWFLKPPAPDAEPGLEANDPFVRLWTETMSAPAIPVELDQRRRIIHDSSDEFAHLVRANELRLNRELD